MRVVNVELDLIKRPKWLHAPTKIVTAPLDSQSPWYSNLPTIPSTGSPCRITRPLKPIHINLEPRMHPVARLCPHVWQLVTHLFHHAKVAILSVGFLRDQLQAEATGRGGNNALVVLVSVPVLEVEKPVAGLVLLIQLCGIRSIRVQNEMAAANLTVADQDAH